MAVTIVLAPLSFGAVQLRASELFNHLAAFNKRYILAVAIGCAIANMFSPLGIVDVAFGTIGTIIGTSLTYFFAKHTKDTVKKIAIATVCQVPAMLPIALELNIFSKLPFLPTYGVLVVGETISMILGGIFVYFLSLRMDLAE